MLQLGRLERMREVLGSRQALRLVGVLLSRRKGDSDDGQRGRKGEAVATGLCHCKSAVRWTEEDSDAMFR